MDRMIATLRMGLAAVAFGIIGGPAWGQFDADQFERMILGHQGEAALVASETEKIDRMVEVFRRHAGLSDEDAKEVRLAAMLDLKRNLHASRHVVDAYRADEEDGGERQNDLQQSGWALQSQRNGSWLASDRLGGEVLYSRLSEETRREREAAKERSRERRRETDAWMFVREINSAMDLSDAQADRLAEVFVEKSKELFPVGDSYFNFRQIARMSDGVSDRALKPAFDDGEIATLRRLLRGAKP